MASDSLTKLVLFACVLLLTFSENLVAGDSDKVKLNLYYESLCPGCQEFIVDDLSKIFDYDLYTITHLKLVPFGNAKLSDNLTITCQHGEEECKLNALEACAIRTWPDPIFIQGQLNVRISFWQITLDVRKLSMIVKMVIFRERYLILRYATQTISLKPPHEYVPWVTLNGKPLDDNVQSMDDLMAQICKAYKGKTALPKVCNSSALMSKSPKRKVWKLQVLCR
ncbi:hypothetical protein ARALYDRAFT_497109 [Arabidopsis lyrata subsp. lyrata]|uniref:Gamma interferon inducible lysosomal thiol reductase family protein n=1 Tax=Arabidopsis lyrata subsp. lyrata TaxID=81972 RepID=D7MVI0_ARALL|nr:hypothetical protein ARALYDRAFT_497109 [Arabidopsis lyrata subsp. lyrata]